MATRTEIAGRVRALLAEVLDLPADEIQSDTSTQSTASWTSLNHLMLVSQLESTFDVVFSNQEIAELTSVDRIVDAVERHGGGSPT